MSDPPILPADDPASLDAAAAALWAGGIVGVPTETVYGICVAPRAESLRHLLEAKHRPEEKGLALLVDSFDQVDALAVIPAPARRLAERYWPGPLTLVLAPRNEVDLPAPLYGPTGQLGFRLPDHRIPRALAARLGPLALTSANLTGEPDALTAAQLVEAVGASLALVLDDGPVHGGVPSTVVAVSADGSASILRPGPLDPDEVTAILA